MINGYLLLGILFSANAEVLLSFSELLMVQFIVKHTANSIVTVD